jgi:hypothetical protein
MAHLEKLCELRDKGQNPKFPKITAGETMWSEQDKKREEIDAWRRVMAKVEK